MADPITLLGALQTGFSIANTLAGYLAAVKDAKEDIQSLASELDSTLRHLQELDESSVSGRGLNANGRALIDNVRQDSEDLLKRLVQVLKNSKTEVIISPDRPFRREDIDLSIFKRAAWPLRKPEVDQIKQKLVTIKLSILLARSVQQAKTSKSSTERRNAESRLLGLEQSRSEALKRLRRMENKSRRLRFEEPARAAEPSSTDDDDDDDVLEEVRADVLRDIEHEERQKRLALEERKELETRAVSGYKQSLLEAFARLEKERLEWIDDLERSFEPSLTRRQIQEYVRQRQQSQIQDEELKTLSEQFQQLYPTSTNAAEPDEPASRSRIRQLFRPKAILPTGLQRRDIFPSSAPIISLIVRTKNKEGIVDPFHVPMSWLIEHMKREEKESLRVRKSVTTTMKVWGDLPDKWRDAAHGWLDDHAHSKDFWSLVFAREQTYHISRRQQFVQRLLGMEQSDYEAISVILVYRRTRFLDDMAYDDKRGPPTRPDLERQRRPRHDVLRAEPGEIRLRDETYSDRPAPVPLGYMHPPPPGVFPDSNDRYNAMNAANGTYTYNTGRRFTDRERRHADRVRSDDAPQYPPDIWQNGISDEDGYDRYRERSRGHRVSIDPTARAQAAAEADIQRRVSRRQSKRRPSPPRPGYQANPFAPPSYEPEGPFAPHGHHLGYPFVPLSSTNAMYSPVSPVSATYNDYDTIRHEKEYGLRRARDVASSQDMRKRSKSQKSDTHRTTNKRSERKYSMIIKPSSSSTRQVKQDSAMSDAVAEAFESSTESEHEQDNEKLTKELLEKYGAPAEHEDLTNGVSEEEHGSPERAQQMQHASTVVVTDLQPAAEPAEERDEGDEGDEKEPRVANWW